MLRETGKKSFLPRHSSTHKGSAMFSNVRSPRLASLLAAATFVSSSALAQTTPPPAAAPAPAPAAEPAPDNTLTANIGLFSQYGFRSISQTGGQPAVQGGFDYAHSSGFY